MNPGHFVLGDKMIKAVIFDLDGTLVNSLYDLADATNYALKQNRFPIHELEKYKYFIGNGIPKLIERALPEENRDDATCLKVKEDFFKYYSVHYADKTVAYEGMVDAVNKIKAQGIKIAVVTNKADVMAKTVTKAVYGDIFDMVMGLSDKFPSKPSPESTLYALEKLGVNKSETVFVGDSAVDMQTGVNCGIVPIGVLWGFREEQELLDNGARFLAGNAKELLRIIGDIND